MRNPPTKIIIFASSPSERCEERMQISVHPPHVRPNTSICCGRRLKAPPTPPQAAWFVAGLSGWNRRCLTRSVPWRPDRRMKPVAAGAFQDGATRHKPDFERREEGVFIAKVGALHRVNGENNGSMGCRPKELRLFFSH